MDEPRKRNVAYKLKIGDILNGKPVLEEEKFRHLELGDRKIVRVNLVANIVDKFSTDGEKNYGTLTADDASGQIRLKMFGDDVARFESINPGDTVMIIGLLRHFNDEVYLSPEIITPKDPRYLLVRKLELEGEALIVTSTPVENKSAGKDEIIALKDQLISMIKNAESIGGVDTENLITLIKASPELINKEIKKMLEEGLIYEPRPGKIRYLG